MSTFNPPADIAQITLAKSSDVNAIKAATAIAFGLLPDENKLQRGTVNFAVDTGTANTYVVALDASITTYTDGLQVVFRPLNSNSGTSTINLNGLGAKSIRLTDSSPISAGDISAGAVIDVRYSTATGFFHLTPNSAIYAADAGVSADAAAASASAASVSASAASSSASSASSSASSASTSASNAASSASTATTQAGIATTQATNASTSATTATTQAGIATTQAGIATTQATNASTSATTATTQAGIATTQATNAASSATAAAASYDSFDDRYLGSKASDPTLDNDGNALLTGALYWNSSANVMKVYNGGTWSAAYVSASSTGASIRPSLLLDFANSKTLDPRITFTRASTATYTGYDGLIKTATSGSPRFDFNPTTGESLGLLIEEARTNLLTYSEQFDNAAWTKSNATITVNATIAPDGTLTADKLVENTANGGHDTRFVNVAVSALTSYTQTVYFKASERTKCELQMFGNSGGSTLVVDLSAVTASVMGAYGGWSNSSASITPIGSGWYRVSHTSTTNTGLTLLTLSFAIQSATGASVYTGDGTSGLYIWGAQLEAGAFPTSYIPSADSFTSRASAGSFIGSNGLIQSAATNVARYNYNPLNLALSPKLLLEPAATNLLTYSEDFANAAWTKLNATVTTNATTAPDGTVTADKLVENTVNGIHTVYESVTLSSGTGYAYSFFAKAGERSRFDIVAEDTGANAASFDLSAGTVSAPQSVGTLNVSSTATISSVGNGWYRCVILRTTVSSSANVQFRISNGSSISYTGDGTSGLYIWGAQLETGTSATSYIQTVASQVTRAADVSSSAQATRAADNAVMTGTNFSSWYRQDEGTVLSKFDYFSRDISNNFGVFVISDGDNSDIISLFVGSGTYQVFSIRSSNIGQAYLAQNPTLADKNTSVATYKFNDSALSLNGITPTVDTLVTIPQSVNRAEIAGFNGGAYGISQLNGHIAKLAYYPKRLSNAELQSITTV